jgi:hypothetical protein
MLLVPKFSGADDVPDGAVQYPLGPPPAVVFLTALVPPEGDDDSRTSGDSSAA